MKEIRKDYVLDRYVVISPERKGRPSSYRENDNSKDMKCPFCSNNDELIPEPIKEIPKNNWQFRLLPNKFPVLEENDLKVVDNDIFYSLNSYGSHEILVETPVHEQKFCELEESKIVTYLDILTERYGNLKDKEGISYVSIFKNKGHKAGESIGHSHSQIISSPIVPEHISKIYQSSGDYYEKNNRCPYCDITEKEINKSKRIIKETGKFIVLSPYASKWPYESWIIPKRHFSEMDEIDESEKGDLAKILKKLLMKYNGLFENFSYNLLFYSFPVKKYSHFHVIVRPKLKSFGGSEEFGLYINEIPPEKAARDLKIEL
ncbi:MAG: galactose-1-phosphate uridylyltransferase [Candidatus Aenigmatarchaeota archaeon]